MKYKIFITFTVVTFLFMGGAFFTGNTEAKTINLKFSSPWPPKHPQHTKVIEPWAKKVHELTGGKVTVQLFPGQALGKAADQYEMASMGICDIALTIPSYTPGRFKLASVFLLPFRFECIRD